jgi:hypothetical protein
MMADADIPFGIDRARHQEMTGRNRHVWWRRAALTLVAALPVLGLLNVFGQRAGFASYQGSAASLLINSPAHVRGGLVFTTEIVITPRRQLRDARLFLDEGWFAGMTLNGLTPQPANESAQGRWQVWDFGRLPAGVAFRIWIAWQVNPTNVGRHSQDVGLYDGGTLLMTARRAITVFP